ncbi:Cytochrome c, mono- and diheme variants [Tistlia consotensis]|uniref:Cytochrome c, mono-and diheme variants n=1 Tax=Tistlia consotensis USBA 355 TaxID=560819 RepID=A0A1Y6CK13_9PROT|nr:cytochrome c [Tistlia consotensis]SMF70541.1 Cytochrome c, mono-and diheme variants [Tistlia consotensis USBA 355]SNS04915.1 Cytochrome c, mono- and diheme variants [Tistlia consotensis]
MRLFSRRGLAAVLLAAAAAWPAHVDAAGANPASTDAVARGAYLVHAGGCVTCHTAAADGSAPLAGGRALKTPFGTFHTPNLTPDPETGLGSWSEADFLRALKQGIGRDGSPLYPAFPYVSYSGMTDADARDLFAYLKSLPPVRNAVPAHELRFPYDLRWGLWLWRLVYFDPKPFRPDPAKSESWNRGDYLVHDLGHCGECHTPRDFAGAMEASRFLAGTADGPDGKKVPNITPDPRSGIGDWSAKDITFFLQTGFLPNGDVAGGAMGAVIEDSTSKLTDGDRAAIADYLLSVTPKQSD